MYGLPVSICASSTANHSCCARTVRRARPSRSYLVYSSSNPSPQQSASPGASLGQKSDQSSLASTRFMNRSFTHRP